MFMHIIIMHMHILYVMTTPTLICILRCTSVHIVAAKAIQQNFIMIRLMLSILLIKDFGFLIVLTPKDPRKYGYQNSHHLLLMQVRALTKRGRIGALVVDAMDLMDTHLTHHYQGILVGQPPCLELWSIVSSLVTISKTPNFSYMLLFLISYSMIMF